MNKVCKICGKQFQGKINSMYCSAVCRSIYQKEYGKRYRELNKDKIREYQQKYHHAGRIGSKRPIISIDYRTNKRLDRYSSITEASRILQLERTSIQRCLSGEYNHTHGYTFIYEE